MLWREFLAFLRQALNLSNFAAMPQSQHRLRATERPFASQLNAAHVVGVFAIHSCYEMKIFFARVHVFFQLTTYLLIIPV